MNYSYSKAYLVYVCCVIGLASLLTYVTNYSTMPDAIQQKLSDSVVLVETADEHTGTGFVIEFMGRQFIITAGHVCGGPLYSHGGYVAVGPGLDDVKDKAYVVFVDKPDVCILAVPKSMTNQKPLSLTTKHVKAGDPLYMQGYPKSKLKTWTDYVQNISAEPNEFITELSYMINVKSNGIEHGASGSPALNEKGDVVGMVTQYDSNTHIGQLVLASDIYTAVQGVILGGVKLEDDQ